ncbi:MAG: ATP-binding protein [Deltaproteobacteria bacterium]
MATIILWRVVEANEKASVKKAVKFKAASVRDAIDYNLKGHMFSLVRMARRWEMQGRPEKKEWVSDAGLYMEHFDGYKAIAWIDAGMRSGWAVPAAGDLNDIKGLLKDRAPMPQAMGKRGLLAYDATLKSGNKGVLVAIAPIHAAAGFDGAIVGVYKIKETMDAIVNGKHDRDFSVEIRDHRGGVIYSHHVDGGQSLDDLAEEEVVELYGLNLLVRVSPGRDFVNRYASILPTTTLFVGLLLSAFIPLILHLGLVAYRRALAAEAAKSALDIEVSERKSAEEAAEKNASELAKINLSLGLEVMERKKAEEAAKKYAEDLNRSNKELEQFAYVASHDLQEPLRIVSGYVQLIQKRYKGRLDAAADEFMHFAVDGAKRMQVLINDLLQYSRVGSSAVVFAPVDCAVVLQNSIKNLQASIEESMALITHDRLPTIEADAEQLEHLFMNLLSNAIKYGGSEPPRIHVSARDRGGEWLFSVKDNGIGIDPRFSERIFVIFQRLHGRHEYSGTGIGLAICKKVVENHGGRIWVASEQGRGSEFYFTIPMARRN